MGLFDVTKAASMFPGIAGGAQNLLGSMNVNFGTPTDIVELNQDALNNAPTSVLGSASKDVEEAKHKASEIVKENKAKIIQDTGISEVPTDRGRYLYVSNNSDAEVQDSILDDIQDYLGYAAAIAAGVGVALNAVGTVGNIFESGDAFSKAGSFKTLQKEPLLSLINT